MSDPVRITNPGAESLGYDSDGHEIMAVDIYVNPPRVDVFHGTPPAWSSFGNKTIWGGNEWVDDSPTRSGNDSNLLIVFYVQIMPDDFVMQLHRF